MKLITSARNPNGFVNLKRALALSANHNCDNSLTKNGRYCSLIASSNNAYPSDGSAHLSCSLWFIVSQNAQLPWNTLHQASATGWLLPTTLFWLAVESAPPVGSLSYLLLGPEAGALPFLLPDSKSTSSAPGHSLLLHAGSWLQEFCDLTVSLGMALGFSWFRLWFVETFRWFAWAERVFFSNFILEKPTCWFLWMLAIICKYAFGVYFRNLNKKSGFYS